MQNHTDPTPPISHNRYAEDEIPNQTLFHLLVNSVKDYAIFTLDTEGRIATWSNGATQMKGYSAEDIIGTHFSIFYPSQDIAEGKPNLELRIALREGKYEEDGWRVRKDGSHFWANVVITPMWDAEGQLLGYAKVTRDITERAQLSGQIDIFFELSHDMLLVAGYDGYFKRLSPSWEKVFGYSLEEMTAVPWLDFVHPDDLEATRNAGANLFEGENVLSFENRYRCKDGCYRWLHWNAITYPKWQLIFAVGRDITERKHEEETQRLQIACLREQARLLDLAHDAILVRNMHDNITFWNNGAELIYGWRKEEVLGQIPHSILQTQFPIPLEQINQRLVEQGDWEGELIHTRRDGEKVVVESRMALLRDESGQPLAIMEINRNVTRRKQAEETLKRVHDELEQRVRERTAELYEREEQFRATFEQAAVGIAHVAPDGKWLRVNRRISEIVGYSREELLDRTFQDITHPEDINADLAYVAQVLADEIATYSMEKRYIRKDGSIVWINLTVALVRQSSGEPKYFIAVVEDISARKSIQDALLESDQRMRLATQATGVGLWEWNVLTGTIRWDAQMFRIYGITPTKDGSIPYSAWTDAVLPEDLPRQEQILQETVLQCGHSTREFRIQRPDDREYRHIQAVETVRANAQGQVEWVVGTNLDITERKQAEVKLKESEARYRFLADSMPQIVWTSKPDGNLDYYNQRWFEYTGMTLEETLGWGWKPVLHPDDLQNCIDRWNHSFMTGEPYEVEYRFKRASDGVYRWHLGRALPHRNEAGEVTQWVGTCTDIEEFKQAQAALLGMNDELAMRVREQTSDLVRSNEELQLQQHELALANARLEALATMDGLTGLKNHRTFQEYLEREFQRALRYQVSLSVILLDVDKFKDYNDTFGHPAGDEVLKAIAQVLLQNARTFDMTARYGGEEFVLVLPNTDSRGAIEVAERMRQAIVALPGFPRMVTASFGVATCQPSTERPATLIEQADQGLYTAKRQGRNRVCYFGAEAVVAVTA